MPQGHGREWLRHLAEGARRFEPVPPLAFAVAPPVAESLRAELAAAPLPGLSILSLSEAEVARCSDRRLAVSGLARWATMRRWLARTGAPEGLFLELDHLSLPLALGLPLGAGRSVSGILFRPSVHYEPGVWRHRDWRRDLRKDLLYRRMLRHPALTRVLSLDEGFPAFARARYRRGDKVEALVDPAFPLAGITGEDRKLAASAPAGRALFVLFGVLAERKGVPALLRALARLDAASAGRIAVIVAGVVDPAIGDELRDLLARLAAGRPELWIRLEDRRLAAGELAALVEASDAVLAPYQRFVGSSGVLLWAASRGRPVIAQDYGLVGRLVREHGLGLAVDTTDPAALASALATAALRGRADLADPAALARFVAGRTPEAFADGVLGPLAGPGILLTRQGFAAGDRKATSGHGLATRPAADHRV
ncbi:glycosyltransferase [Tistlia consotensis]|nr:glycosyltransferase [Tistlia consotensis]